MNLPRLNRVLLGALLLLLPAVVPTLAAAANGPGWQITSTTYPTNLEPAGRGSVLLEPINVGGADSSGPITVTDTLPEGVTATAAGTIGGFSGSGAVEPETRINQEYWECSIAPGGEDNSVVTCHNNEANMPHVTGGAGLPVRYGSSTGLIQTPIAIALEVAPDADLGVRSNLMSIEGGGAQAAVSATDPIAISATTPPFGLARWDGWFSNADGTMDTTAGSVPYSFNTGLDLNTVVQEHEVNISGREARNYRVLLPPGFIGNPRAVTQCPRSLFDGEECPRSSIIGTIEVITAFGLNVHRLVFNLVPPANKAAQFAFTFEGIAVYLQPSIRTGGDYGVTTQITNTPQREVVATLLTLWGVPNDPSHRVWRRGAGDGCAAGDLEPGGSCYLGPHPELKPFLRMPTSCAAPDPFSIAASTWFDKTGAFTEPLAFFSHDENGQPSGLTGCNRLPFDPTISSKPTTNVADAPSGLDFDLHIPQPESVNAVEENEEAVGAEPALHEADLKNAVVTLPKGLVINPSSANGLDGCSEAQIELNGPNPASCPDAAKIGTVDVDTPLVDHPVSGAVYVARPFENKFHSLLAIYLAINDPQTGTVIKLAGQVKPDPSSGQLTTSFEENPQLPFEDFHLQFFGGAHAALRTPQTCGAFTIGSDLTPWSSPEGADAFPSDSFELTQGAEGAPCVGSEAELASKPSFTAGTLAPKAGAYSPFLLHLARKDGSQEITGIDTTLPEGLIGKLAGIGECSDGQIAAAKAREVAGQGALEASSPSCPSSSEVGTVKVGAGAGPDPYYVTGHAYLAGPYKGAPLSLEIISSAVAGPYDLGAVAVRTALYLNPETAQIHAVSDPIPHILAGIPLDVRTIDLELTRPQFTLNPTSCEKKTIIGSAGLLSGQSAALSNPFQVGECKELGFKPSLALALKGGTKRTSFPALTATLTYPAGAYANIASAQVTLPHSEFLEQSHIKTICTRVQFAEGQVPGEKCPAASIYGRARAVTPLLDSPLEGPVYLRSSSHHLPDLVVALNGQINVDLDGRIDSVHGGLRSTFEMVPDAPVSKFVLEMQGGKKGLLVNSTNICKSKNKARVAFTAQNGKAAASEPVISNDCKGKAHRHGKAHKKHKGHGRH